MKKDESRGNQQRSTSLLEGIQYSIDFIAAVLLFTGQISITGIFVVPEGFYLSATGPVLGGVTVEGLSENLNAVGRTVDRMIALLLVLNVIRVTGPYITSGRFFIVISGEIFGIKEIVGAIPLSDMNRREASGISTFMERTVLNRTRRRRERH